MRQKRNLWAVLLLTLLIPCVVEAQGRRGAPQLVRICVRAGETIQILAERFNVPVEEIARLNGVEENAELPPGAEILMPSSSAAPAAQARAISNGEVFDRALRARAFKYESYISAAAARYAVDPRALWTIAFLETRFRPDQISPKGARGLMQFMPATATTYGLANPFDAPAAIDAAARYVRDLSRRFNNRLDLVLASYNAGEGTVAAYLQGVSIRLPDGRIINPNRIRTGGVPPYAETKSYVGRGVEVARALTTMSIFSTADLAASNMLLTMPAAPDVVRRETIETPTNEPAQSARTLTMPTSSYAFRAEVAATEKTNSRPAPQASDAIAPTAAAPVSGVRSFRPSAPPSGDESSSREATTQSVVSTVAPQPRSTRVMVGNSPR